MFQPVSFFIGLRYSRSQNRSGFVSFITFFSIAGILLGIMSLITVVSVMNGFEGELKKKILGLVPHIVVSTEQDNMADWQQQRERLLTHPQVQRVTPFIETEALIQSPITLQGILLQGIVPEYEADHIINQHMVSGQLSSLSEQAYSAILGQSLAHKLAVGVGEKIRLVLPNKTVFTPMGRMPVTRTFTVSAIFNVGSQIDDAVVYIHSRDAAKLMRSKGDGIKQLRLYLDDAFHAGAISKSLKQDYPLFQFTTWNESQGALFSAVSMEKNMMWLMLSLIIAVAAFNIVSALVMVVIDKQGEIGILQTLGLARADIVKIFITQGMVNGLWGAVLGSLLGVVLTLNLNNLLALTGINIFGPGYATQVLPVQLEPLNVVVIVFSALMMTFIATLYPAYRASKTLPAEVLRNE